VDIGGAQGHARQLCGFFAEAQQMEGAHRKHPGGFQRAVPASTQFLIAAGQFVQQDGVYLLLGILAAVIAARASLRQPRLPLEVDRMLLRLPLTGGLIQEVLAARFTRVLGNRAAEWRRADPALSIARDAMGNRAVRLAVEQASLVARGGGSLTVMARRVRAICGGTCRNRWPHHGLA
jgi:type II secretory pathway component PulF